MKLYADAAAHRTRQLVGDTLLVLWVVTWLWLAHIVHDATMKLAAPGERLTDAGGGLADRLRDAGASVRDLPLVGEQVRVPLDDAGDAADKIAGAGTAQVQAVEQLAFWLGLCIGAIPILVVCAVYLPLRWRFAREATAGQKFIDAAEDLDLFALRALTNQPMHRLARISDDPAGAWRRREADVVRSLALLELGEVGLRLE